MVDEPFANVEPDEGPAVCSTITPSQLSVANGVLHDAAGVQVFKEMLAGHAIIGCCVSFTVTVNEQVVVLPPASVTLNEFVVTPTGKVDPLARPAVCVVTEPEQLSVPRGAV